MGYLRDISRALWIEPLVKDFSFKIIHAIVYIDSRNPLPGEEDFSSSQSQVALRLAAKLTSSWLEKRAPWVSEILTTRFSPGALIQP
jgi:hypothetical protein